MKKIKYLGLLITCLYMVLACSKMNDKHDFYLEDGEIIYIGRVDSARILPGNERFVLRYWIRDSRAKELKVFWNEKRDSSIVSIPEHQPTDSIDVLFGGNGKIIPEGNYTFQLISTDGYNLKSVPFEVLGNVYGGQFASTLVNRFINGISYHTDNNQLIITWGDPSSFKDIGIEITYFEGEEKKVIKFISEKGTQTTINNFNIEKRGSYRTMFLPESMAIDTFFTDPTPLVIIQNIALNKPVKTSSNLNDDYTGSKAVDGIISTDSRWISSSEAGLEHWIEIDLEKEFNLVSFKLHKHLYQGFSIPNFTFQAEINGEWINILKVENDLSEVYEGTFPDEIKTDKVRLFVPNYENNMVRIMEIDVYAKL